MGAERELKRIALRGAAGRMGSMIVEGLAEDPEYRVVVAPGRGTDLGTELARSGACIALDFTRPEALEHGIPAMLRAGLHVIVGTSGATAEQLERWDELARELGLGVLVVPNFSIGACLLMRFAREAAAWFADAEIIELHHAGKVDSPSGTARATAELIAAARSASGRSSGRSSGRASGNRHSRRGDARPSEFRGGSVEGIPVHSVRLPGLLAHQLVVFGGRGETLSLRHDSLERASFLPGIRLALRRIEHFCGLRSGLEACLESD